MARVHFPFDARGKAATLAFEVVAPGDRVVVGVDPKQVPLQARALELTERYEGERALALRGA